MGFAFQRFLQMLLLVVIALLAVFLTQRLAPGGPFDGERPPPARILENLRAYYDMDLSMPAQFNAYLFGMAGREINDQGKFDKVYWLSLPEDLQRVTVGSQAEDGSGESLVQAWCPWDEWLTSFFVDREDERPFRKCGIVRGDFGLSMVRRSVYVNDYVREGVPATLRYAIPSLLFALGLGIPMGLYAAYNKDKAADVAMVSVGMFGTVVPNLVMAPLVVLLFAIGLDNLLHWLFVDTLEWIELTRRQKRSGLNWIPSGRPGGIMHYVLPTIVLGTAILGRIVRLTRAGALEALNSNYVRTARAKGLPGRIILFRHVFKPAILPVVTYLGPVAAAILTGSLIVEQAFALPGLGRQFVTAATDRDYSLLMGTTVILLLAIIFLNFLVDLTYSWLDPRIRRSGSNS
ncbi:MAG: ABC transporter permease [Alphaproteobacteria bacterium]